MKILPLKPIQWSTHEADMRSTFFTQVDEQWEAGKHLQAAGR
jgi:hypothetical protein